MNGRLHYLLHSGKNSHLKYFVKNYIQKCIPAIVYRSQLDRLLQQQNIRQDRDYILQRVGYYNKLSDLSLSDSSQWDVLSVAIGRQQVTKPSVYYYDSMAYARYFDSSQRWILLPGDITEVPAFPSIVKSRPICDDNANSVLLNMDKVRHFLFVDDKKAWRDKRNVAIFRGDLGPLKENRNVFMRRFGNGESNMVDAASTNCYAENPGWQKEKMTIGEHLDYKFIMSLEGNDVASNLKWVMSSNSVAVMPRPTCETWFMEGMLIPDYHYIEVKADFSDLEERLTYYIEHPAEAEAIISHAHEYVDQFRDKHRERLISLLVLKKYFEIVNNK